MNPSSAFASLLSPALLFFALGAGAAVSRVRLEIPPALSETLALFLMVAVGLKGGFAMAKEPLGSGFILAIMLGLALSFVLPVLVLLLLRATTRLDRGTAVALSAHYGSVSIAAFATAVGYLDLRGVAFEGYIPAVMAIMEPPAIISALLLAGGRRRDTSIGELLKGAALNGSVVLLLGSLVIGLISGDQGQEQLGPLTTNFFSSALCLFLLIMGFNAIRNTKWLKVLSGSLLAFGIYMPLIGGGIGLVAASALGFSRGGTVLFGTLGGGASYLAVPAAMRLALPEADAGICAALTLGITLPFNLLVGIPLYYALAQYLPGR